MRNRIVVLLLVITTMIVGWGAPAQAGAEESFVAKINAERSARGLAPLQVYWDLVDDARAHSQRMMDAGDLHHNPNLGSVASGWRGLGENVGVGGSVAALHQAFMNSTVHRNNILGDFNYVGVGVTVESDTKMWVTVVFMKGAPGLVGGETTTTTTSVQLDPAPPPDQPRSSVAAAAPVSPRPTAPRAVAPVEREPVVGFGRTFSAIPD